MPKTHINLKQYTPLIHFQSGQQGATIRGTELKPKLDRFLVECAFKRNYKAFEEFLIGDKSIYKKFIHKDEDENLRWPAFDYKVRFKIKGSKQDVDLKKGTIKKLILENIGGDKGGSSNNKEFGGIFINGIICMEIFSFYPELIKKIEEYIVSFFAVTNFGHRQNKGFGSFFPVGKEELFIEALKRARGRFWVFTDQPLNENSQSFGNMKYSQSLSQILNIYKFMKSGSDPYIYSYMLNKGIGNEKTFMKRELLKKSNSPGQRSNEKYVKGLLGVAEEMVFKNNTVAYQGVDVERFQSPISFKVVGNYIAIIPEKIPEEMFETGFDFTIKGESKEENPSKRLYTPSSDEFNLEEFLVAFTTYLDSKNSFTKHITEVRSDGRE